MIEKNEIVILPDAYFSEDRGRMTGVCSNAERGPTPSGKKEILTLSSSTVTYTFIEYLTACLICQIRYD